MSVKVEIELKCMHCDKRSKIPASGKFPRHCAVHGTGYYSKRVERGRDCAGSGVDATERVVAEAKQRAGNCGQRIAELNADIVRLHVRVAEESERVESYASLIAKMSARGAK